jgi:Leucine-rich repeat (LRR) protein
VPTLALGHCKKLEVLQLHGNRLRKLGTWVVELPLLRRLYVYDNPMIDPPAEVGASTFLHVNLQSQNTN